MTLRCAQSTSFTPLALCSGSGLSPRRQFGGQFLLMLLRWKTSATHLVGHVRDFSNFWDPWSILRSCFFFFKLLKGTGRTFENGPLFLHTRITVILPRLPSDKQHQTHKLAALYMLVKHMLCGQKSIWRTLKWRFGLCHVAYCFATFCLSIFCCFCVCASSHLLRCTCLLMCVCVGVLCVLILVGWSLCLMGGTAPRGMMHQQVRYTHTKRSHMFPDFSCWLFRSLCPFLLILHIICWMDTYLQILPRRMFRLMRSAN